MIAMTLKEDGMDRSRHYVYLNAFFTKSEHSREEFDNLLVPGCYVKNYSVKEYESNSATLYVKCTQEKRPKWSSFLDELTGEKIPELTSKSSSSVLFWKTEEGIVAFVFGYGRFLIDISKFAQDFGIKTALNMLNHESLRSVDLYTLDDQPIQKRAQAVRESRVDVFGIDISRDVLRAVTGTPKNNIDLTNITGGDAMLSFGRQMEIKNLPAVVKLILKYYKNMDYKKEFAWVDNIRRTQDRNLVAQLDEELLKAIKEGRDFAITMPEIVEWDSISGFSFTRSKSVIMPTIDSKIYLETIDINKVSIESLKHDKIFVTDVQGDKKAFSVYKMICFEVIKDDSKNHILFAGVWYEIDKSFMTRINTTLDRIPESTLSFPKIETWIENGKLTIESEGDYNIRAAKELKCYLLDKKLVKSSRTTTPIEVCDLLTNKYQMVHVKHRKGGSAGLSHLFAQGSVSADVLLADNQFRKMARKVLKKVDPKARDLIPEEKLISSKYEIVFLILGEGSGTVKKNLPFFSKVNLANVYDKLSQQGFKVAVCGAETTERSNG
jgi:uncharacterized protein (TIGR04141 family)